MFNVRFAIAMMLFLFSQSFIYAGCCGGKCCQSVDFEVGWRRDNLKWKLNRINESSFSSGRANDHQTFDDINSYTLSTQAKWVGADFYVRCSAEYGLVDKGRAHESFNIRGCALRFPFSEHLSSPIKRRSEVYDFNAAVGYPLAFFCCRLSVIPLVGFSFHRQHLRVKTPDDSSSCCTYEPRNACEFFRCHSSSSFFVKRRNAFRGNPSSNPFSSSSSSNIASELGLSNPHHTDAYRFTWYGFYLGADLAYALDGCWTLFWDTQFHLFDSCHRKRKSWTGVYFVDDYHKTGFAYGFNNLVGFNCYLANCWYVTGSVDFNWWKAPSRNDEMHWNKVGAKLGFTYQF